MSSPTTDYSTRRVYQAKPITLARSLGFGVLDLMGGGWNTIISGLMLYFFTTYGNVSAVEAGTILFVARIVDAVISLLIGPLTDNFYRNKLGQKYGRRHFFLLIGAQLLLVVFPLLWVSHQAAPPPITARTRPTPPRCRTPTPPSCSTRRCAPTRTIRSPPPRRPRSEPTCCSRPRRWRPRITW